MQPELNRDFDGKRDRWAGYDPSQHKAIIEQYQKIEEAKRDLRAQKLNADGDDKEVNLNYNFIDNYLFKINYYIFRVTVLLMKMMKISM